MFHRLFEGHILFKLYRDGGAGMRGYVKLSNDVLVIKNWGSVADVPLPGDILSFTDAEILQTRKRFIAVDGNRFKKIKPDE